MFQTENKEGFHRPKVIIQSFVLHTLDVLNAIFSVS